MAGLAAAAQSERSREELSRYTGRLEGLLAASIAGATPLVTLIGQTRVNTRYETISPISGLFYAKVRKTTRALLAG